MKRDSQVFRAGQMPQLLDTRGSARQTAFDEAHPEGQQHPLRAIMQAYPFREIYAQGEKDRRCDGFIDGTAGNGEAQHWLMGARIYDALDQRALRYPFSMGCAFVLPVAEGLTIPHSFS